MDTFPPAVPFWGADRLVSVLHVTVTNKTTAESEDVVLTNQLAIKRGAPYSSANGMRRIDLAVQNWNAKGYSKLLAAPLRYQMNSADTVSPSFVEAMRPDGDYPARMVFSANFDVFVGDEAAATNVSGNAIGNDLRMIPPAGVDTLQVNKTIDYREFAITAGECRACRMLLTGTQSLLLNMGTAFGLVPSSLRDQMN